VKDVNVWCCKGRDSCVLCVFNFFARFIFNLLTHFGLVNFTCMYGVSMGDMFPFFFGCLLMLSIMARGLCVSITHILDRDDFG
jgi:hypothetical protein